ncbi:MAG: 30S ribosomal protein S1 [Clostridiales bacterium]|jgi:4-hydroxy-3-methylbut-2-enyl diphosphate reductase|nr:30S ribosomal protein S1 [Clostridiales bacterium]
MSDDFGARDTEDFGTMLSENLVTLHTGEVVRGTVIQVTNSEISVDLQYKSDGVIQKSEFSNDPAVNLAEAVQTGQTIEALVIRVNDGEGNVQLSTRRLQDRKGFAEIEEAFNAKKPLSGRFVEVVKGGMKADIKGAKVFVPSSQVASRYVEDLSKFVGKEFDFSILEFDGRRKIVAGRKELAIKEEAAAKEEIFGKIEAGSQIEGVVSRVTDFGAFVDLGGVDGLIHISELSWGRVKHASDVVKAGDKVIVNVIKVDREKSKISLSLKDLNNDPWVRAGDKYAVGDIVTGVVVRIAPFGAFVELSEGIDGLVHVSQISHAHVNKPEDALKTGDSVTAKVTEVDAEGRRISLSIKEALPKPESEGSEE